MATDIASSPGRVVALNEQAAKPGANTKTGYLYTKSSGGQTELFYENDAGTEEQLTSGGSSTVTGSGTAAQVAFWSSASALTGDAGLTFAATTGLFAQAADSATTTITDVQTLYHTTSGTPAVSGAAGFGLGTLYRGQDSVKTAGGDDMARTATYWTTATIGSEASTFTIGLRAGGAILPAVGAEQFQLGALGDLTLQAKSTSIALTLGGSGSGVTGVNKIVFNTNVRTAYVGVDNAATSLIMGAQSIQYGTTTYLNIVSSGGAQILTPGTGVLQLGSNGVIRQTLEANGDIVLGIKAAIATNATSGHGYVLRTSAGTPTGVPGGAYAGQAVLQWDTTNKKMYVWDPVNAAWLGGTAPGLWV